MKKAGLYLFNITSNHIFQDGNKRTGLEAAILFIRLNNRKLKDQLVKIKVGDKSVPATGTSTNEILYDFVIEVASGQLELAECQQWFRAQYPTPPNVTYESHGCQGFQIQLKPPPRIC